MGLRGTVRAARGSTQGRALLSCFVHVGARAAEAVKGSSRAQESLEAGSVHDCSAYVGIFLMGLLHESV